MTDADIFHRIRFWLIRKIAGKMLIMINVHLIVEGGRVDLPCVKTVIKGMQVEGCHFENCGDMEIRQAKRIEQWNR